MNCKAFIRTWNVETSHGVSFPFFQTTRRDHSQDQLFNMLPQRGIGGYLVPIIGGAPCALADRMEHHNGKSFISLQHHEVVRLFYVDTLPAAERLQLFDMIQASTTEST